MQPSDRSMRKLSPRFYQRREGVVVTGFLPFLQLIIRHDNYIRKLTEMGFIDPSHVMESIKMDNSSEPTQNEAYYTNLAMEALHVFLTKVMRPQPWVKAMIDDILEPVKGKSLIGFHIRMGSGGSAFKDTHTFLLARDVFRYADEATRFMEEHHLLPENTRWIVATDSDSAEKSLRDKYGELIVTSKEFHRGHSKTGAKDDEGFSRAVIDMLVLGRCDYLVLTKHSTFSVVARTLRKDGTKFMIMNSYGYCPVRWEQTRITQVLRRVHKHIRR